MPCWSWRYCPFEEKTVNCLIYRIQSINANMDILFINHYNSAVFLINDLDNSLISYWSNMFVLMSTIFNETKNYSSPHWCEEMNRKRNTANILKCVWFDLIWFDLIWFDLIWFDLIWLPQPSLSADDEQDRRWNNTMYETAGNDVTHFRKGIKCNISSVSHCLTHRFKTACHWVRG